MRPFLPPLAAGALARGDLGVDFEDGDFAFLERPGFLLAVLGVAVAAYALERVQPVGEDRSSGGRRVAAVAFAAVAVALGALLFAGSLTEGGREGWAGLPAGAACAALGYAAAARLLRRAGRRLDTSAARLLPAYADGAALALAAISIAAPPVGFLVLAVLVLLLVRLRETESRKYEGLRMLR